MPSGLSHAFLVSTMWAAVSVAQVTIPYIPTHTFTSSQGSNTSDVVYILQPNSDKLAVQLLALNLSSTINPSIPSYTVLYDDVPFFTNNEAYVPMLDTNGSITVFTGNCNSSQEAPRLWSFQPDENSSIGNGSWSSTAVNGSSTNITGPGYLASGFAYNSSNDTSSEYYTFGGMCPFANGNESDWTSNADYSNEMTALTAPNTSTDSSNYIVQQTDSSNSPIAEAGYTVTPLQKTSSTTSGGVVVQQESFLFIGGHTQTAFLNMSTLALFSLPQASWSYISIGATVDTGRTDLAIRDTTEIEPRSGHSAVMSSDGSKIVVYGGWVGDTSTPADPQLAILEVGEDYGGSGEWTWSIPVSTGSGPASGSGIFGHATTMLAGDVMMILGGYIIPASSATSKRASSAGFESSSQVYLYNLTSNSWVSSYTAPSSSSTNTSSHTSGALSSSGEKAGLGIGVSAAAIAIVCIGYFYWSRKRWSHRRQRDQELRKLALGAERSNIWGEPGIESSYRGPSDATLRNSIIENVYSSGPSHQYSAVPVPGNNSKTEAERSGLLYDVPSPSRGLRRSLSGRPQRVQSANWYEDSRMSYGPNTIHPIDEQEEYETPPEEASERRPESGSSESSTNNRFSDPFKDPPPSPTRAPLIAFHEESTHQQDGNDGASIRSGKSRGTSPDKSERTHSDLSESSRSGISEFSIQRSNFGSQRRSTRLFQSAIPTLEPSNHDNGGSGRTSPEKSSQHAVEGSSMRWPFERSGTIDSYSSSASRHRRGPLEGDTLLGSGPEWSTPPESPSRLSDREHRPNSNNSQTWMGSIRKTLSNARKVVLSSYGNSSPEDDRDSPPMFEITSPVDFDDDEGLSPQISRRASSASVVAHHQRRKQGPKDWAVDGRSSRQSAAGMSSSSRRRSRRTNDLLDDNEDEDDAFDDRLDVVDDPDDDHHRGGGGSSIGATDDEDWDVELAAEGRLVQITYTIPKERLRVVNAGAGDRVIGDDVSEVVSRTSQEGR